jgi:hypothetical protein
MSSAKKSKKPVAKPKKASPVAVDAYDPDKDRRALHQLIARHGKVAPDHREAFDDLISDARRADLGARTRGAGVLREGIRWAVTIAEAFAKYPAALEGHYAIERYTYLLHTLDHLDKALVAQKADRGGKGTVRSTAADREAAARSARNTLIAKLTGFAGAREPERKALSDATGTTSDTTALGASIQGLVALGSEWLARTDAKSKIQAKAAGLTESVVQNALAAAEALTGAAATATLTGRNGANDSPAVNLAEGAVLFEMDEAQRCFEEARKATPLVPRLVPGPATRHLLGKKTASKAPVAEADTDPQDEEKKAKPNGK